MNITTSTGLPDFLQFFSYGYIFRCSLIDIFKIVVYFPDPAFQAIALLG